MSIFCKCKRLIEPMMAPKCGIYQIILHYLRIECGLIIAKVLFSELVSFLGMESFLP
jgi:hypothetical protein